DGSGVGIAVLDSGLDDNHHDVTKGRKSKVVSVSFVSGDDSIDDAYGHGTHVATLAAGTGNVAGLEGQFTGIAPQAQLINVRVLGDNGSGKTSDVIAGIDWCLANKNTYNIRVINLSLGVVSPESFLTDPLCQAAERAVAVGIVVVAAAGNQGKDSQG